jgi:putative chitinase
MAQQKFRVNNPAGMWVRTEPVVSEATKKVLLPNGQLVEKQGETAKPDWWRVSATVQGTSVEGFSNKTLMIPDGQPSNGAEPVTSTTLSSLLIKTLAAVNQLAPQARASYLQAIREGGPLFEQHGITTPLRMSHFMAQAMAETGGFNVLRESMSYNVPRMLKIFGVGHHSARVTAAEAPSLAQNEHALAERVYGLGNPEKASELGNTQAGDGFRYRGNGVLQTTGRGAHKRMGQAFGLDFEGNPELVTLPEHALKPALKEWSNNNLNHFADQNDISTITERINGGFNGFDERKAFFAKLRPRLSNNA